MANLNNILIPNVTKLSNDKIGNKANQNIKKDSQHTEFEKILHSNNNSNKNTSIKNNTNLEFSKHALQRIEQRHMNVDSNEFMKLKNAIGKLKAKGGKESLVITNNGAYIIDVNKGRVVTAMDKEQLKENVFTKIDSTLFLN